MSDATAPARSVTTRILVSIGVVFVAFAATVGFGVIAQRQAARDSEELAKGFVPAALRLGELLAVQTTLSTLLEKAPGDRDPSTRVVIETLVKERRTMFAETRAAIIGDLVVFGSNTTRPLAAQLATDLDSVEGDLQRERAAIDGLLQAVERGDDPAIERTLLVLGPIEIECIKRLRAISDQLLAQMTALSELAKQRERRAIFQLLGLSSIAILLGILVAIHVRRVLLPLARVTERARAVAQGDLTEQAPLETQDEVGQLSVAFERMVGAVARAQSRAVANERLAAIGKMAAHVTHEIRNPLSSIVLNLELLEEEVRGANVPAEVPKLLSSIVREVERLEHLSEEYLRVARLPQPSMEADDIARTADEVVTFVESEMSRANCTVRLEVRPSLPHVLFDESQIRQALLNLLRNAREAMPEGGTISVSVAAEGMSVLLSIVDEGAGIPEEIRARVFDPFFSTKGEGTGLGLAITRQIVEAHGGSLSCEPRAEKGTRFVISLPIAPTRASFVRVPAS